MADQEKMRFEPKRTSGKISDDELLQEIARVVRLFGGETPTQAEFIKKFEYSMYPIRRRFGSYKKALEHAGFKPPESKYTRQRVIEDLKRILSLSEKFAFSGDFYKKNGGLYSVETVKSILNSNWEGVMAQIGAKPRPYIIRTTVLGKKRRENATLTRDDLLEEIGRIWKEKGQRPTYGEFRSASKFGMRIYERTFGSWKKAIEIYCNFNNPSIQGRPSTHTSKEILLRELRSVARKRSGDLLDYDFYKQNGGTYSIGTFQNHFGSWTNAVKAVGSVSKRHMKYSKDVLFDEMQRVWERLGEQPTCEQMQSLGNISPKSYRHVFGSWRKAVRAFCDDRNGQSDIEQASAGGADLMPRDEPFLNAGESSRSELPEMNNQCLSEALGYEIRKTGRLPGKKQRFRILQRDNFVCRACGRNPQKDGVTLEVDHIKAYANGGETEDANLQTLCRDCNSGKSDT